MTPTDLTITPRDRRFGRGQVSARHWLNGDPIATAFFNALSITFPRGEAYFIDSVRAFRDGVPERLGREIAAGSGPQPRTSGLQPAGERPWL